VVQSWIPEALTRAWDRRVEVLLLGLFTIAAVLVHGYHPFAEDAEIYLPGVEKILHPGLFPAGTEFFESHAHLTLFPNLIALCVWATHLPLSVVLFLWYCGSIFLLLLACWKLSGKCFTSRTARWAGVALVASLLTLPVAGTALYIMDQYTNPRNVAAFAEVLAVSCTLEKKYLGAALWLAFAALVHPLMSVFAVSLCVLLVLPEFDFKLGTSALLYPLGFLFRPTSQAYHEAVRYHSYFYLREWKWYGWLGILAPVALLWWFGHIGRARRLDALGRLCRTLIVYDLVFLGAALVISIPQKFEVLARLEPMRSLYLLYVLMFLIGGGFMGEYVLKGRIWRWLVLFAPLCVSMFLVQRVLFPASRHIEWPWSAPKNPWAQAFLWVRGNTPVDARFAVDPDYMHIPGEDQIGFRALAERGRLADVAKDSGAVSMFPPLANQWLDQVQAQQGWRTFNRQDFERLHANYGTSWVVLQRPAPSGLDCPYENSVVTVCHLR